MRLSLSCALAMRPFVFVFVFALRSSLSFSLNRGLFMCGSLGSKGASSDQEGWRDGERNRQAARHGKVYPDPSRAAMFRAWWSLVIFDVRPPQ